MTRRTQLSRPEALLLDGVTGTGKSTLLQLIRHECPTTVHIGTKLTDRPRRSDDTGWEYRFVERIPPHLEPTTYSSVGNRYAIDTDELAEAVRRGLTYVTTCANYGVIDCLRQRFAVAVVYIYRPLTSVDVRELMRQRGVESTGSVAKRTDELDSILSDYASGMSVYDFVLLNVGSIADFETQARALFRLCGLLPAEGLADV